MAEAAEITVRGNTPARWLFSGMSGLKFGMPGLRLEVHGENGAQTILRPAVATLQAGSVYEGVSASGVAISPHRCPPYSLPVSPTESGA